MQQIYKRIPMPKCDFNKVDEVRAWQKMQAGLEKKQTNNMLKKVQLELSQETDLLSFSPSTARIDV